MCGDALDFIAPGVDDLIEGDPVGFITDGFTGGVGDMVGGDIGTLINGTAESLLSGGYTNLEAGLKQNNFYDAMDHIIDPTRINDRWIRGSGELLGKDGRDIMGHYIIPAVGTIAGSVFGGPLGGIAGSAAGKYMGGKVAGDSDRQNGEGALISAGTSAVSGVASPYVSGLAQGAGLGTTAANVVGTAATQAGVGAASAAAQGLDPLDAAAAGALGGALGSVAAPVTSGLGEYIDLGKAGYGLAGGVVGAGSSALSGAVLNGEVSPMGLLSGATQGAWSGYNNAPELPDVMEASRPDSEAGFTKSLGYNPNEESQADYNRRQSIFNDWKASEYPYWTDYNAQQESKFKDSLQPSKFDGLGGKLAGETLKGLGSYFMDHASTPMPIKQMAQFAAPTFGLLNTARPETKNDGFTQNSSQFQWDRQDIPLTEQAAEAVTTQASTPDNNIFAQQDYTQQPKLTDSETQSIDWADTPSLDKVLKKDENATKKKKDFTSKDYKLDWRNLA